MKRVATAERMDDGGLLRGALAAAAGMSLALGAVALMVAGALDLRPFYVAKVLAGFAAVVVVVAGHLPAHHPFPRFGPANHVTLARVAAAALLAGLIGEDGSSTVAAFACAVGACAALLDAVDGRLARATGLSSRFGARFDMETDAALILILAVLAWQFGKAGPWVLAAGLARYAFVAAGCGLAWLRRPLPPSFRRKLAAAVVMGALVVALAPVVAPALSSALAAAALAFLAWSFATDVIWLHRHAGEHAS
jgi:phosphatidylglycerophosphate synthase